MSVEINLMDIIPKYSYTNSKVICKKDIHKLIIYYINYYTTGKLKTNKFQPAKAEIPKKLIVNDSVAIAVGLYFGDGQKSIKSKSYQAMRFANSEYKLNKTFLEFLNQLNVKNKKLNAYLCLSTNLKPVKEECIHYWSTSLDIPSANFYKVGWDVPKNITSKFASKGTLSIMYNNSSFRLVFDAIYKKVLNLALVDKIIAKNVLKGIIASDGNVFFKASHRQISIAAKPNESREYVRKLFEMLNIHPNKDCLTKGHESITITGYSNLKKAYDLQLCDVHPNKQKKLKNLINSYKNICYRKQVAKKIILKHLQIQPSSVKELAEKLNRTKNAIRRYLYMFEEGGLVKRTRKSQTSRTGRYAEVWELI
jgi:hypothetical protein